MAYMLGQDLNAVLLCGSADMKPVSALGPVIPIEKPSGCALSSFNGGGAATSHSVLILTISATAVKPQSPWAEVNESVGGDPGTVRGREELALVVAEDREEREREEKEEKTLAGGAESGLFNLCRTVRWL
ncbi:hypothetical protein INR49_000020 [Caranx melampygus]|nr:hypothetical protein INR49_000020 [Caranx melampygus]